MRVLFIGGTGIISSGCAQLALERGIELFVLNRGQSQKLRCPRRRDGAARRHPRRPEGVARLLQEHRFDAVVDWVAFTPEHIEQDLRVFGGRTRQFVFISSASAYQKPPLHYRVTEDTPLVNPRWQYSRDKIACEDRLMRAFRDDGFPVTIVRPSLTYGLSQIPLVLGSWRHPWTMIDRMRRGVPVIVPGDGTSLWTVTWNGDFAKGLVGLLGRDEAGGHAFHITSDEVLTWDAIYAEAAHAAGVEPRIVHIASDWLAAQHPPFRGHAARRQGAQRRLRQLEDQAVRRGLHVHGAVGGGRPPQPRVVRGGCGPPHDRRRAQSCARRADRGVRGMRRRGEAGNVRDCPIPPWLRDAPAAVGRGRLRCYD